MLSKEDICAIIVTYNCDSSIKENIELLLPQVKTILLVDNGSNKSSVDLLNDIYNDNIEIIYNKKNMGIAYGLNQGLKYAYKNSYKLYLTMDQDSKISLGSIAKMLEVLNLNKSIISVGPNFSNILSNKPYKIVDYLISSGNLTYTDKAMRVKGYTDNLFIDSVDFDFSLKLRSTGNKLAYVYNSEITHKIGEYEDANLWGKKFKITAHSPLRNYYIFRNYHYIIRKYHSHFPKFCLRYRFKVTGYFFKLLLIQNNKKEKLRMIFKGIRDGKKGIYGDYHDIYG